MCVSPLFIKKIFHRRYIKKFVKLVGIRPRATLILMENYSFVLSVIDIQRDANFPTYNLSRRASRDLFAF